MAIGCFVFLVWIVIAHWTGDSAGWMPIALAESSRLSRWTWLAFRVAGAVTVIPVAEELAYRGFLMRRLASRDFESVSWTHFSWMPVLISSAAYGALQGERWLPGTIAGFCFAVALLRRGRIGEATAAHAIANGLLAVWTLLGNGWMW